MYKRKERITCKFSDDDEGLRCNIRNKIILLILFTADLYFIFKLIVIYV